VVGAVWIVVAQIGTGLPIATAIVVIGYGSMGLASLRRKHLPRSHRLSSGIVSLTNLLAYVGLTGLAIAAQWDLALRSPVGHPSLLMAADHALAILLLLHLTWRTAAGSIFESP